MGIFDIFKKKAPKAENAKHEQKELEKTPKRNPAWDYFVVPTKQTELTIAEIELFDFYKRLMKTFVVFDLETTGLNENMDQIIEIGAVRVSNGEITDTYNQLINPGIHIPTNVSAINHITDAMVMDQPTIEDILGDFLVFVNDDLLVAHNAKFDIKFLAQACMRYQYRCPDPFFDSMKLSALYPEANSRKLSDLLVCAGIQNASAHRAMGDAMALASFVLASESRLMEWVNNNVIPNYSVDHCTEKVEPLDAAVSGLRFCVTGFIEGYERYDFEKMILLHGGKVTAKISNLTDYLVVGSYPDMPASYKSKKELYAEGLIKNGGKIKIINPEELISMITKG